MVSNTLNTQRLEILVPPLNFAMILPGASELAAATRRLEADPACPAGVYRSGHPNLKNFPFMDTLHLRSIM